MKRILLIEPDWILAKTYKQALELGGDVAVTLANTAQAAIGSADNDKPDLVILEIQLIEHSGIEFLYEFRSYPEWQSIPVIVHTIVPFNEFQDNWHLLRDELGVCNYLYKPHTSLRELISFTNTQKSLSRA
jgi:DNA-binding response OmpR family regulator